MTFDDFIQRCRVRLVAGQREYGDKSFDKHPLELLTEIQEELQDTANWAFILCANLERLREEYEDAEHAMFDTVPRGDR